jgi:hypothetical protein
MPYQLNEKHVVAAFAPGHVPHPKGLVPMHAVQIGNLVVTSQAVLAMDNGRHPVTVALADFGFDADGEVCQLVTDFLIFGEHS